MPRLVKTPADIPRHADTADRNTGRRGWRDWLDLPKNRNRSDLGGREARSDNFRARVAAP